MKSMNEKETPARQCKQRLLLSWSSTWQNMQKVHSIEPSNLKQTSTHKPTLHPLGEQPCPCQWEEKGGGGGGRTEGSGPCYMPAKAKPRESASPLTWGQSSPSSGVISVSLWTTTLVTDMSGCCSLASLIAWASAYPQEITEGQRQKGGGTCMISSKLETSGLDLDT